MAHLEFSVSGSSVSRKLLPTPRHIYKITGKPVFNSEFGFYSDDNRSGNKNRNWIGGGEVSTQEQRGIKVTEHLKTISKEKFILGAGLFQWSDQPPSGRRRDGEDVNWGIVDIWGVPYKGMVKESRTCGFPPSPSACE